jgi:hypothetical protein
MPQMHQDTAFDQSNVQRAQTEQSAEPVERPAAAGAHKKGGAKVPAWRRIEALKERRELKEALSDIWAEDPEFDDDWLGIGDDEDGEEPLDGQDFAELDMRIDDELEP